MEGKTFKFTEECMKNFGAQSVLSMLFSHLERELSAELVKMTYETLFICKAHMKRF